MTNPFISFVSAGGYDLSYFKNPVVITNHTEYPFIKQTEPNPPAFLLEEISKFMALEDNWDGYAGIALLPEIGNNAQKLVHLLDGEELEKVFDIFPNSHGTLTIQWVNANEEKLSLEIGKENYSYFADYISTKPVIVNGKDILQDIKNLKQEISQLFGKY